MKKVKYIFAQHYEAIKLGMITGVLVANIFLISKVYDSANKQAQTTEVIKQQIAQDNQAREETRKANAKSDREFRAFICSLIRDLLIAGNSSTSVDSLKSCADNVPVKTQTTQSATTTENEVNTPRKSPTTSEPPEKQPTPEEQQTSLLDGVLALPNALLNSLRESL